MVIIFALSGILSSSGWNTAQVLIKYFASLAMCLAQKVIIRKPLYRMVFKTGKVPWRSQSSVANKYKRNVVSLINQQQKSG